MRLVYLLGMSVLLAMALVACGPDGALLPESEMELPEAVQAALARGTPEPEMAVPAVINVAVPLSTAEPTRERLYRSYPAPTGEPAFRVYYQKRCYPGCHSYPTPSAEDDTPDAEPNKVSSTDRERPYRSYPAPTGAAGFRKYYQKRCYPGCHSYPTPTAGGDVSEASATEEPSVERERPYRSYPAPTGAPGFRKYYQKRCYPGCHTYPSAAEPTRVHP